MKPVDRQLNRLLKAAADAPGRPVEAPSIALERRVLSEWRAGRCGAGDWSELVAVFRRGLAFATLVAVAAVVVTLRENPREDSDYFATRTEAEFELALR